MLRKLISHPRQLFLVDGVGACLTGLMLGLIFPLCSAYFGMPEKPLRVLAMLADAFAVYSLSCSFFARKRWESLLLVIVCANTAYCLLTAFLLLFFADELTPLGIGYFILEILVICGLVSLEAKAIVFQRRNRKPREF